MILGLCGICMFVAVIGLQSLYENQRRQLAEASQAALLKSFAHDMGKVKYLTFSSDGSSLASAVENSLFPDSVFLWDTRSGQLIKTIDAGPSVLSLHFGNDPDLLIVGLKDNQGNQGGPHLWNIRSHQPVFDGGLASVHGTAISPDDQFLVACANRGTLNQSRPTSFKIWNLDSREQSYESIPDLGFLNAAFSPDGAKLAIRRRSIVELWDFPIGEQAAPTQTLDLRWFYPDVSHICFSSDGTHLAAASSYGMNLWNISSGTAKVLNELPAYASPHAIAFSHDRARILFGSEKRVWVIDWGQEKTLFEIQLDFDVTGVAISRDNQIVAAGGHKRIQMFDGRSGKLLRELQRQELPITARF